MAPDYKAFHAGTDTAWLPPDRASAWASRPVVSIDANAEPADLAGLLEARLYRLEKLVQMAVELPGQNVSTMMARDLADLVSPQVEELVQLARVLSASVSPSSGGKTAPQ